MHYVKRNFGMVNLVVMVVAAYSQVFVPKVVFRGHIVTWEMTKERLTSIVYAIIQPRGMA